MKKRTAASLALALVLTLVCAVSLDWEQRALSDKLIRLHVVGASNSNADQNLKLKIKDEILLYLRPILEEAGSSDEAAEIVSENLENISAVAENTGKKYGRSVTVKSEIKKEAFPTRGYDTFSLPVGYYTSLRVTIDGGAGKNWWCVVYPDVCADLAVDGENYEELGLTEDEAGLITRRGGYEIKFRLIEVIENLKIAIFGK